MVSSDVVLCRAENTATRIGFPGGNQGGSKDASNKAVEAIVAVVVHMITSGYFGKLQKCPESFHLY